MAFLFGYQIGNGQNFSAETNAIYINPRKAGSNVVKLPQIEWVSPLAPETDVMDDSISIAVLVNSDNMLKSITLVQTSQGGFERSSRSILEDSFRGEQLIRCGVKLTSGTNLLEIVAENFSDGRVSSKRYVNRVSSDQRMPKEQKSITVPQLVVKTQSIAFSDRDKNGILNANEEAIISFVLQNIGAGNAKNLSLTYSLEGNERGISVRLNPVLALDAGQEATVSATLFGGQEVQTGKARLVLNVLEPNGFDSDPVQVQFNTQAFQPPVLAITDAVFNSISSNALEKNKTTGLQILVQNIGNGTARNVSLTINVPEHIFFVGDPVSNLGDLLPGEARKVEAEFIVTTRYRATDVPFRLLVDESEKKFGAEKMIAGILNQPLSTIQLDVVGEKPKSVTAPIMLRSAVDASIPLNNFKKDNRYALIIGNEDYTRYQPGLQMEQNVAFARNDASVFREYLIKALGVPAKNSYLLLDATRAQINRELDRICELAKLDANSELIIFYAGHGLPDMETRKAYIIPVDVSGSNIKEGISLSDFYSKLAATKAARITIFLDACFSGGGRGENGLLAARSVKVKPTGDLVDGNIIVFTASSGEEVSLPIKTEGHGLFTFHLLKILKERNGSLTMQDLVNYLSVEVPRTSLIENGMKQTPQLLVSPKLETDWKKWTFY